MSLMGVVLLAFAVVLAVFLIRLAASQAPRLGVSIDSWVVNLAVALVVLIAVIYVCRAFGVFQLLSSVRV